MTDVVDFADPFDTAALRDGVLAAWRSSPTRFREDANAESDLVLGGYADRLLVELAQNAADAAQRAGVPGHLRVSLVGDELRAANTGAPLDADGVAALAALRASAKRGGGDDTAGRFGVGFAAVLAVSDEPSVRSGAGGVAFSAARTVTAVGPDERLRAELARRDGRPPVLRLVWPTAVGAGPPDGFDTEVRLPLRDGVAGAAVLAGCAGQAADLLLALPWLARIDVGERVARRAGGPDADPVLIHSSDGAGDRVLRWRVVRRAGRLPDELLAGLGAEARAGWSVCWALPVDSDGVPVPLAGEVLHAPTRTAERLTLPARLIAGVPVEPSRRHVQEGPAAGHVLAEAARGYPDLARSLAAADRTALVPEPGFPAGEVDATLRAGVLAALRDARWLAAADGSEVAPAAARVLDVPLDDLAELLAEVTGGILDAELSAPRHAAALAALDVPRLRPAAVADLLGGLDRPPAWWRRCYAALAELVEADPSAREELGALPVPLTDGRTVTGPRGVLLGGDLPELAGLDGVPEARLVHPEAAHPLLARLGARPVGAGELLDALRDAVARSVDDAEDGLDTAPLAAAVLGLAERAGADGEDRSWLGALALRDTEGEPRRADELVTPDAPLSGVLAPDGPLGVLHPDLAAAHPAAALRAVGVLDSFAVLDVADPAGPEHDLDGEADWWAGLGGGAGGDAEPPARLLAVRDLDLVDPDRWPAALRLLAAEPGTWAALHEPGGYTGWWLARHARLDGHPPRHWRLPAATGLAGLYDPVPAGGSAGAAVDDRVLAAAGVRAGWVDLRRDLTDPDTATDLLARLADPARTLTPAVVHAAHTALAGAVRAGLDPGPLDPPARVRAITGAVADADRAVVLDTPWLAAVLDPAELVAGGDPAALADLLDLPMSSDGEPGTVLSTGVARPWGTLVEVVAAAATTGTPLPDGELTLHDVLRVRHGGAEHEVAYWVTDGAVHAADPVRALIGVATTR